MGISIGRINRIHSASEDFISKDIYDLKCTHRITDKFTTTDINTYVKLCLLMVMELWRRT